MEAIESGPDIFNDVRKWRANQTLHFDPMLGLDRLKVFALTDAVLVRLGQSKAMLREGKQFAFDQAKKARVSAITASTCSRTHGNSM